MHPKSIFLFAILTFCMACEAVESSDIRTSGVYARFEAKASADGATTVKAELTVGENSNTYLDLVAGAALQARQGEDTQEMARNNLGSMVWYETSFSTVGEDSTFSVAFERDQDDSAPNSQVSLPAPFDLTVPAPGDEFLMGTDKISVAWNNVAADAMTLLVSGNCFYGITHQIEEDEGVFEIEPASLEPLDASAGEFCTATVTLTREREGTVDEAFGEGGTFKGKQVRSVDITVNP